MNPSAHISFGGSNSFIQFLEGRLYAPNRLCMKDADLCSLYSFIYLFSILRCKSFYSVNVSSKYVNMPQQLITCLFLCVCLFVYLFACVFYVLFLLLFCSWVLFLYAST